ncbi:MAG: type III secretion system cytoplasmic ring protein SctQ [Chlamydiota bacterium]
MTSHPILLKKITSAIAESLTVPMWGTIPSFPWEKFCNLLQNTFQMSGLHIAPTHADWKDANELLQGLGDHPSLSSVVMSPLASPCFLAMPHEDAKKWTSLFLDKEHKKTFTDENLQKGFFRFNLLHILQSFYELNLYKGLTPKLQTHALPHEKAYCIDLQITHHTLTLSARLIFPASFHSVLTSHFTNVPFSLASVDSSLELPLKIQIGKVALLRREWLSTQLGDFVILDSCSYHPTTHQGTFLITLENTPLFIVKNKHNELKILDYALYEQKDMIMEKDKNIPPEDDDAFENEELIGDDDEFEDEEEEFEDFEEFEDEEGISTDTRSNKSLADLVSSDDVILSLCVEVAHIKMPLNKLLSLQPGNTLQLPISVENGVSITLNSQVVARGELLQLSDMLGVKISEICH